MSRQVHLEDIINTDNFRKIQDAMSEASDMAMLTVDFAGKPVTPHSRCSRFCTLVRSDSDLNELCRRCDSRGGIEAARLKKPYIYLCHRGVLDFAVPLIVDDTYIGAIMAGQVVVGPGEQGQLETIAGPTGPREPGTEAFDAQLSALKRELPVVSLGRVRSTAQMMFQVCNYIIEEAQLKLRLDGQGDRGNLVEGAPPTLTSPLLRPALDHIRDHYSQPLKLDEMARLCRISPSYFSKLFNQTFGESVSAYVNRVRIQRARKLLLEGDKSITVIALDLGFEDSGYFDKVFKKFVGETPSQFRRWGQAGDRP